MQQFIQTSLIGGQDGDMFNDIYLRNADGSFVVNDGSKGQLDIDHPVKEMTVYYNGAFLGFNITYQLTNGKTATFQHGSGEGPPRRPTWIGFGASEIIIGVFGRAGYDSTYKRDVIQRISFVVYDKVTANAHIVGSFGQSQEGKSFYCSDVLAFGGFAQDSPDPGLSGLYFFKNMGTN